MRLTAIAALVGCYHAPARDPACSVLCMADCPDDMSCVNGFCVAQGERCEPSFRSVAAGNGFACALDSFSRRWCWGANDQHQLDPSERTVLLYATIVDSGPWDSIATGGDHTCGLRGGELYCWGGNDRQQVSGTVSGDVEQPLAIVAPNRAPWTSVVTGLATTCGIAAGRLYCWGANNSGQAGVPGRVDVGTPTEVDSNLGDWQLVAVGREHGCAVSAAAGLHCWGSNYYGQLGNGGALFSGTPLLATPVALAGVTALTTAAFATCAVAGDQLYCWGRASNNTLGDPAVAIVDACIGSTSKPILASTLTGWSTLTSSRDQVCGLHGGELWCWGTTTSGLGDGVWGSVGWLRVADGVTDVSVGWNPFVDDTGVETSDLDLTCFIVDGNIRCWGDNRYGQLAQGAATMAPTPVEIAGNHVWSTLQAGDSHACGIDNGVPLCWGTNRLGTIDGKQAGVAAAPCTQPDLLCAAGAPVTLPNAAHADAIKAGDDHTCVLDGQTLTCWGNNAYGQLGSLAATSPFVVPGAWTGLYGPGAKGQCANQNGQAYCWGAVVAFRQPPAHDARLDGMLYIGMTAQVGDASGAGSQRAHGCALGGDHKLSCFGVDTSGEFGRGPPAASCGNGICDLNETEASCASDCVGKRTCTTNSCGQQSCSPVCGDGACNYGYGETCSTCAADCGACPFVALGRTYDALSVGWNSGSGFSCAVRPDKQVECWGRNVNGQAGALDGSGKPIDPVYTPNVIVGLSGCTEVSAAGSTACAICEGDIYCWGNHRTGAVGAGPPTAFPITTPRKLEIALDDDRWVQLVSGTGFTCARSEKGRGVCWGFQAQGALGTGATALTVAVPILMAP